MIDSVPSSGFFTLSLGSFAAIPPCPAGSKSPSPSLLVSPSSKSIPIIRPRTVGAAVNAAWFFFDEVFVFIGSQVIAMRFRIPRCLLI
tara:strand:- start:598 stop:861 length:264 start_codon:yes stop_codon:yes gene_type:complete